MGCFNIFLAIVFTVYGQCIIMQQVRTHISALEIE